ncbi:MAG: ion transporter [Bacteroidetes bacterium]|nr:MAG: ion transporter [Bacteroidota bacterium]
MANKIKDPGFGIFSSNKAKRYITDNGATTVVHINKKWTIADVYLWLIEISWTRFFLFVTMGYIVANIFFGIIYTIIGIESITEPSGSIIKDFLNGFFFSAQTITTVGYGGISPHGTAANLVSTFEALVGLLSFSFITGLLYGRFSRPNASVRFSKNLIFRDFNGKKALMFRLMNNRTNMMIKPRVSVSLGITKGDPRGEFTRDFYQLKLERNHIQALPTIWTVVHEIDEDSPLFNYSDQEILRLNAEIFILLEYYDDAYAQDVYKMHSYSFSQIIANRKFVRSFVYNKEGYQELDHDSLDKTEAM